MRWPSGCWPPARRLRFGTATSRQLEQAGRALGAAAGRVSTHRVDVTDEASVAAATKSTMAAHSRIDALVNSAGITGGNAVTWELEPSVWREVLEVNLTGCYLTCRSVVPVMVAAGWGRIVNIASVAGKDGNPNAAHYSASKAGLIALTKSLGKELAKSGVLVNAVTPAAASTAMFETMKQEHIDYMLSKIPMGRFLGSDRSGSHDRLAVQRRLRVFNRRGVRSVRRPLDLLSLPARGGCRGCGDAPARCASAQRRD